MFHRYDGRTEYGNHIERVGLNAFPTWFLFISFMITLAVSILQGQARDFWYEHERQWEKYGQELSGKYDVLVTKYQDAQCGFRKLVVTQVENTKLCMDPDTKVLSKIDKDQ